MTPVSTQDVTNIFDRTIAIALAMEGMGRGTRSSDLENVTVDADKDRLGLSTRILQCDEMDAIRALFAKVRASVADPAKGKALPTLFKRGVFLVPIASIPSVEAMLEGFQQELDDLVDKLVDVYDTRIEEDRVKLRAKFDLRHYPSKRDLKRRFGITWRYLSLAPTAQLQQVSADVFERETRRVQREVATLGDEILRTMRQAALEIVTHMHERLGTDPVTGKRRVFRDSMVENLVDFLATFETKNIMGDRELSAVLTQMRGLLAGVEAKDLRTNEALRSAVEQQVAQIVPVLDRLVKTVGRSVELPDDDDLSARAVA